MQRLSMLNEIILLRKRRGRTYKIKFSRDQIQYHPFSLPMAIDINTQTQKSYKNNNIFLPTHIDVVDSSSTAFMEYNGIEGLLIYLNLQ